MASGLFEDPGVLFDEFADVTTDDTAEIDESTDREGDAVAVKYDFSNAELTLSQAEVEEQIREMLAIAAEGSASFEQPQYDDWV
jgi:hypothetical protein